MHFFKSQIWTQKKGCIVKKMSFNFSITSRRNTNWRNQSLASTSTSVACFLKCVESVKWLPLKPAGQQPEQPVWPHTRTHAHTHTRTHAHTHTRTHTHTHTRTHPHTHTRAHTRAHTRTHTRTHTHTRDSSSAYTHISDKRKSLNKQKRLRV